MASGAGGKREWEPRKGDSSRGENESKDEKVDVGSGGSGGGEDHDHDDVGAEYVCATLQARWVQPIVRVLVEYSVRTWELRFFANECASTFADRAQDTVVRFVLSFAAFYAYYVDSTGAVRAESASAAAVDAARARPYRYMSVNVMRLAELLRDPTKPADRITFRLAADGRCSVRVRAGARLDWEQEEERDDDDIRPRMEAYIAEHPLQLCCVDSRRWWSYWRHNVCSGNTVLTQDIDHLTLTSAEGGVASFRHRRPAIGAAAQVLFDNRLVRTLRHLSAYEFATPDLHVQHVARHPLHIGYILDEGSDADVRGDWVRSAHLPLLPPLVDIICAYGFSAHDRSSVDALLPPLSVP